MTFKLTQMDFSQPLKLAAEVGQQQSEILELNPRTKYKILKLNKL